MMIKDIPHRLHERELALLADLRARRVHHPAGPAMPNFTLGDRIADRVAAAMGSWSFIIIQSLLLAVWIVLNVTAYVKQWDPYPFILLNLAL